MGQYVKKILLALILLVPLLTAALAVLVYLQPSLLRTPLEKVVSIATGLDLRIAGTFQLRPSLTPHLEAGSIVLSNPHWPGSEPLARVEKIELAIDLQALLDGKTDILLLQVTGADIHLAEDNDSRRNWQPNPRKDVSSPSPFRLKLPLIQTLTLSDIDLVYQRPEKQDFSARLSSATASVSPATGVEAQLDAVVDNKPFHLDITSKTDRIDEESQAPIPIRALLQTEALSMEADGMLGWPLRDTQTSLRVTLEIKSLEQAGRLFAQEWPALGKVQLKGGLRGSREGLKLEKLSLVVGKSRLTGQLALNTSGKRPSLEGAVEIDQLTEQLLSQLRGTGNTRHKPARATPRYDWKQLQVFDADLRIGIGRLLLKGEKFGRIQLDSSLKQRKLDARLLLPKELAKRSENRLSLDFSGKQPSYRLQTSAEKLRPGELLQFATGGTPLTGDIERIQLDLAGQLDTARPIEAINSLDLQLGKTALEIPRKDKETISIFIDSGTAQLENKSRRLQLDASGSLNRQKLRAKLSTGTLRQMVAGSRQPIKLELTTAEGARLNADGQVAYAPNPFSYQLAIELNAEHIALLSNLFFPDLSPVGPVRARIDLQGDGRQTKFNVPSMAIGESRIKANGTYLFGEGKPTLKGEFQADPLQLIEFFAKPEPLQKEAPTENRGSDILIPDIVINSFLLQRLDMEQKISIQQLLHGEENLGTYTFTSSIREGVLETDGSVQSTYLSDVKFKARVTGHAKETEIRIQSQVKDLDYGGLLKALDVSDKVRGKLDFELDYQGRGNRLPQLLAAGEGSLKISGGKGEIDYGLLRLWGGTLATLLIPAEVSGKTKSGINCLAGRYRLKPGLFKSEGMVVDTDVSSIGGAIQVELPSERLEGVFQPKPKGARLFTVDTPVGLSGTLAHPQMQALPANTLLTAGKLAAGIYNPVLLVVMFGSLGSDVENPCEAVLSGASSGTEQNLQDQVEEAITSPFSQLLRNGKRQHLPAESGDTTGADEGDPQDAGNDKTTNPFKGLKGLFENEKDNNTTTNPLVPPGN